MKNENKYFESAEINFLKKSFRILEIILEEYTYKNLNYESYTIIIPKGRFEIEGIFLEDIEFFLKKFINQNEQGKLILRLDNKYIQKNNIKFRSMFPTEINNPMFKRFFELNELEFSDNFVFSIYKDFNYEKLIDIRNNLLTIIENKKISLSKDISKFLYFQDRILFVHNPSFPNAIQIDLSKKSNRSPDKMYYFISSFVQLVRETGKISNISIEADVLQSQLLLQIQKDHNISFSPNELTDSKKNFLQTKIGEALKERFKISNFQKSTKSYNFKLLLT